MGSTLLYVSKYFLPYCNLSYVLWSEWRGHVIPNGSHFITVNDVNGNLFMISSFRQ